ncbi:MAG: alpha/beta hydrolase [Pseudomonadales bacterium]|jgi:3-oxoadipate enol-lactonase
MPTVSANGIDIYYELGGSGPGLLFISGTGGDLRNRPNVFDGPLPARFEVLAYDQRGLGQSGKPEGAYRMADYADDAAALLDVIGWDRVPVIGVSFGGMVAQELALRHPDRVSACVLACTSAGGAGGASYPLHELEGLPEADRAARQLALSDLRRDAAWRAANPEKWQELMDMARTARREDRDEGGARRQLEARAGHDTFDRLPSLRMPVLVAGGRHDGIAPVANLEALSARIPGARLALFDGGHLFLVQDKAAYPYIIQWVSENA